MREVLGGLAAVRSAADGLGGVAKLGEAVALVDDLARQVGGMDTLKEYLRVMGG